MLKQKLIWGSRGWGGNSYA